VKLSPASTVVSEINLVPEKGATADTVPPIIITRDTATRQVNISLLRYIYITFLNS
jgi:hypothetical protein